MSAAVPSINNSDIAHYLNFVVNTVQGELSNILNQYPSPCNKLKNAIEYSVLSPGKCLRSALLYSVLSLDDLSNLGLANSAAAALELIHTYSLIHDDLPAMDDDDLRRGQPSCHIKFGEATAILVGDALQSMAFNILSDYEQANDSECRQRLKIINILSTAIAQQGMVAGQSLELSQTADNLPKTATIQDLNNIHILKTGKLFGASLQIGAIIAKFPHLQSEKFAELGLKLGLAFQIQDDILDTTKSSANLGKPAKSDVKRSLTTYANIISLAEAKQTLDDLWHSINSRITELEKIIHQPFIVLRNIVEHISDRQF